MKISAYNLLALAHLAMLMVLAHLAMAVAGTDSVSSSSSASNSVTTSAPSKDKGKDKDKDKAKAKDIKKKTPRKEGLCCNASCKQCTRVPCNEHTECKIFGYGLCCRSPPALSTDFSKNVMWGFMDDRDCYVLRKRVLNQI